MTFKQRNFIFKLINLLGINQNYYDQDKYSFLNSRKVSEEPIREIKLHLLIFS